MHNVHKSIAGMVLPEEEYIDCSLPPPTYAEALPAVNAEEDGEPAFELDGEADDVFEPGATYECMGFHSLPVLLL